MLIEKNNVNKILIIFLSVHLITWTLVPSLSNTNLPLDTIEALAWGNELQLGYAKHPPLSAWFVELFYQIFGNNDWAYYFLSQIFVVLSFVIIFKLSEDFFKNKIHSLISILLLEGIYFYNYTSTEFNVNVCQLPFWALTVFYCWKGIQHNKVSDWLLFGVFAALGVLSKYLFIYLLIAIDVLFLYLIANKKLNFKCFFSLITFFLVLTPHLVWLVYNDYTTVHYAVFRSLTDPLTGIGESKFLDHIFYPIIFLGKQIGILIPFFIMIFFLTLKFKKRINFKDKKLLFLVLINIAPIILMFFTSMLTGTRIRTMGMMPFYLYMGMLVVYVFQNQIDLKKIKYFFSIFLFLFILSPAAYYTQSVVQENKRTDYPGKKISQIVQNQWDNNFSNEIEIVVGYGWIYGWYAQNLSYHLESRPKWKSKLQQKPNIGSIWIKNFNEIKNCEGVLYQIEPFNDICMLGSK